MNMMDTWSELILGKNGEIISDMIYEQYDLVAGKWPEKAEEIVLILDSSNEVTDIAFYALGLMEDYEVTDILRSVTKGEEIETTRRSVSYNDVIGTKFKLITNSDYYSKGADWVWTDIRDDEASMELVIESGADIEIVGIIRPDPDAGAVLAASTFGYTSALTEYIINKSAGSEIVKEQLLPENENYDVLTGLPFVITEDIDPTVSYKAEQITGYFKSVDNVRKTELYTAILSKPSEEYLQQAADSFLGGYSTRASMTELIANTASLVRAASEEYLADYSDGEIRALMEEQVKRLVSEKYAEQAQAQVLQIKAAAAVPNDIFGAAGYAAVAGEFDKMIGAVTDENVLAGYYDEYMPSTVSGSTLKETLAKIGSIDFDVPTAINIYAETFEDKEAIDDIIAAYNEAADEEDKIKYTDYAALLMSGVNTMISAVSYALIGFVSISLIVSSIMIGIITYISVLERTKEIGILRSVGASKRDISRVFNAETVIVGFEAGIMGIGVTLLLNIPICIIAENLTTIKNIAVLPFGAGVILVAISVVLTMIAGLIPSGLAAKKDPVIALRSEYVLKRLLHGYAAASV